MSDVERSAYRQPVTPSGLEAIEKGTLTWLDEDMYNNLNTGLLEQYLEEKNLQDSFEISHWDTRKVLIGILIGAVFSGVTAYIGLKSINSCTAFIKTISTASTVSKVFKQLEPVSFPPCANVNHNLSGDFTLHVVPYFIKLSNWLALNVALPRTWSLEGQGQVRGNVHTMAAVPLLEDW